MVLLVGLSQISLLIGIYASAIADDFLPDLGIDFDGAGSELALGLEPTSIASDSVDLDLFVQTDPGGSLPSDGEISALDFFWTTDLSDGLFIDDETNMKLIAGSNVGCVSYEGQAITRTRRGNVCAEDSLLTKPFTEGSDLKPPPERSNPNRLPGSINDPKPRPTGDTTTAANTEEDFWICPSGVNGYRQYAVCDSGRDEDRFPGVTGHDWTLWYVSRCRHTSGSHLCDMID